MKPILFALAGVAAIAAVTTAQAADKVTLQLKWVTQAQFAGYYVAKDKGFYKDEGLDVTIKPGGPDIAPEQVLAEAQDLARTLADGPTFAHAMTKRCIHQEWSLPIDEAIEAEAQAQAICMQTGDFERAYRAFVAKQKPVFEGN